MYLQKMEDHNELHRQKRNLSKMMILRMAMKTWKAQSFHFEAIMDGFHVPMVRGMPTFTMRILSVTDIEN